MQRLNQITRRRLGQGAAAMFALSHLAGTARALAGSPQLHVVRISDFTFAPQELTIAPGDVVMWINDDFAPHTATSRQSDWDTGELAHGATGEVAFGSPGDFDYICAFHPTMNARIRVDRQ